MGHEQPDRGGSGGCHMCCPQTWAPLDVLEAASLTSSHEVVPIWRARACRLTACECITAGVRRGAS